MANFFKNRQPIHLKLWLHSLHPWFLFSFFVLANAILSYGDLSRPTQGIVFGVGIFLPWIFALGYSRSNRALFQKEDFPITWGWFLFLGLIAVFIRFYRIETLFVWPNLDEGHKGMYAIALTDKWNWRFFYTFGQAPPLVDWTTAVLLKLRESPFLSLWFPSAFVSILTVGAAYQAARKFFPKSFSFICGCLFSFSCWPLLMGRLCHEGIWLPIWICLSLWVLGWFWESTAKPSPMRALVLGVCLGLGSFTFTPWLVMVVFFMGVIFRKTIIRSKPQWNLFLIILSGLVFGLVPFLNAVLAQGFGQHIGSVSASSGWFSFQKQVHTDIAYIAALFWGTWQDSSAYVADGGGMLNPLLGAAFFLGLLEVFRSGFKTIIGWMGVAFGIALLPGLLSMNVEMFRVALALPFLLAICALGIQKILEPLKPSQRLAVFLVFLFVSLIVDAGRILNAHPDPRKQTPAQASWIPNERAYQILQKVTQQSGAGWIFTEFQANPFDQTLFVTTYEFNAAENPRFAGQPVKWAAILTDRHYQPFLAPRFSDAHWIWLDPDAAGGSFLLGIIPLNGRNRATLEAWHRAHAYFRKLSFEINDISESHTYNLAQETFFNRPSEIKNDRFLESCYWEKLSEFDYNYHFQEHYEDQVEALRAALQKGYPASHLYFKLGSLLMRKKRFTESRQALESAWRLDPQNPEILNARNVLDEMEKTSAASK